MYNVHMLLYSVTGWLLIARDGSLCHTCSHITTCIKKCPLFIERLQVHMYSLYMYIVCMLCM